MSKYSQNVREILHLWINKDKDLEAEEKIDEKIKSFGYEEWNLLSKFSLLPFSFMIKYRKNFDWTMISKINVRSHLDEEFKIEFFEELSNVQKDYF